MNPTLLLIQRKQVSNFKYTNLICRHCGKEFSAENNNKYCNSPACRKAAKASCVNKPGMGSSICLNCYNYWTCGKYDEPLKVRKHMKEFEFLMRRVKKNENPTKCLKVKKCSKYKEGLHATPEEKEAKRQKLLDIRKQSGDEECY
jgi:hypothetical protein